MTPSIALFLKFRLLSEAINWRNFYQKLSLMKAFIASWTFELWKILGHYFKVRFRQNQCSVRRHLTGPKNSGRTLDLYVTSYHVHTKCILSIDFKGHRRTSRFSEGQDVQLVYFIVYS